MLRIWQTGFILIIGGLSACSPSDRSDPGAMSAQEFERIAYGGRLFDMWYDEIDTDFVPDNAETPQIDGHGGPNGNGTLNGADGKAIANTGHDYRFKNLFGWDMRGEAGIYGRDHQAKPWVRPAGPLSPQHARASRSQWIARITTGVASPPGLPVYGDVMSSADIEALVDFMLAVRERRLPRPRDLYTLSPDAPNGFILAAGGDAERGRAFYDAQCAECHGADGTQIIFDHGEQSLGQHARYYGYAVAMISLSGEPGSEMGAEHALNLSAADQTSTLLDLLAALCDRERYPRGAAKDPDVPDGDPRCGAYLR
jgi:cytochrome c553